MYYIIHIEHQQKINNYLKSPWCRTHARVTYRQLRLCDQQDGEDIQTLDNCCHVPSCSAQHLSKTAHWLLRVWARHTCHCKSERNTAFQRISVVETRKTPFVNATTFIRGSQGLCRL